MSNMLLVHQIRPGYEHWNVPKSALYKAAIFLMDCGQTGIRMSNWVFEHMNDTHTITQRVHLCDDLQNGIREHEEDFLAEGIIFDAVLGQVEYLLSADSVYNQEEFKAEVAAEVEALRVDLEFAQSVLAGL